MYLAMLDALLTIMGANGSYILLHNKKLLEHQSCSV